MSANAPIIIFHKKAKDPLWRRGLSRLAEKLVDGGFYPGESEHSAGMTHGEAFNYDKEVRLAKSFAPGPLGAGYVGEVPQRIEYAYPTLDSHYATNPWVNHPVSVISNAVAALPLKLYKEKLVGGKPKRSEVLKHDALALLEKPNALQSGRDFKRDIASEATMYGEAWQYTDDGTSGQGAAPGTPKMIRLFKAQHIAPVPHPLTMLAYYSYQHNSQEIKIAPHYIASTRLWNPRSDYRGLPPMQVALNASLLLYYMRKHNTKVFQNGTFFGLYMWTEKVLNSIVLDRMKEEIKEEYGGQDNAGKFPILHGGFQVGNATTNAKDGEFVGIARWSREEVLAVFGVPPVAVGVMEYANYANTWQQMKMFYELTIMPLCEMISDMLTQRWLRVFWPNETDLYLQFDYSGVKFLGEEAESADRVASSQVRDGRKTINEWRAENDLPPVEWGDDAPASVGGFSFGLSETPDLDASKTLWIRKGADFETRRARQRVADKRVEADMPLYARMAIGHWADQRQRLLSKLRGYQTGVGALAVDVKKALPTAEDLFDAEFESKALAKVAKPIIARVIERAAKQRLLDIGSDVTFNVLDTRVVTFVENKTYRMARDITQATLREIREIMIDATINQLTIDQIASRITNTYDDFERYRALRVARTESVGAHNGAAIEAYDQGGVEKKGWAAVLDDATRESHAELDGEEIPLRDDFSNGLSAPGVPGKTAGPDVVSELVNCRCTIYAA